MKIAIVLGTRPEIIKMAPILFACQEHRIPFVLIHTGQHYSPNMDEIFFQELGLPVPNYHLHLGQLPYRKQVGFFIKHITEVLKKEKPDVVLVQGDTMSVVAGALAANKFGIKVAHHEAGLRSHDITMLEEVNRIITDHVSDFLFTPTTTATTNLKEEGFEEGRIFLTGNTIVDVIHRYRDRIGDGTPAHLGLTPKGYFLVTAHRAENVDSRERLGRIFEGLNRLAQAYPDKDVVYPMHPRTKKMAEEFGLALTPRIRVIEPVGYFDMLKLQKQARLIITDSGGIQEEACVLEVPVVTIRDNTERPETVDAGVNVLVPGLLPDDLLAAVAAMIVKEHSWQNPFGSGDAALRIIGHLTSLV